MSAKSKLAVWRIAFTFSIACTISWSSESASISDYQDAAICPETYIVLPTITAGEYGAIGLLLSGVIICFCANANVEK